MKSITRVKICGLRETEDILAAAEAGADFVGMVFAPGKRQITPEKAAEMVKAIKQLKQPPAVVGVFVNAPAEEVNKIASDCNLDLVQLSGDEDFQYCFAIEKPIIKVIHVASGQTVDEIANLVEEGFTTLQGRDVLYLLDTKADGEYGGTGRSFSREVATGVAERMPVIVAGGLDPKNIGDMVVEVQPWGVDVSSGVETDSIKDRGKIKEFIREVRAVTGD